MNRFVKILKYRTVRRIITIILLTVGASSCEHKPLCWHHPHTGMLRVDFAWWDAPEGEDLVKSMALYVYPKDESNNYSHRIDFVGTHGGLIELKVGDYNFLCLNSDTETLLYENTNTHNTFAVYTRNAHPLSGMEVRAGEDFNISDDYETIRRAEGTQNERVSREAEEAYGHAVEDIHVHGQPGVVQVVTLYPKNLTMHFHVVIDGVECIETIQKISGTLSGLSGRVKVMDASRIGEHNIVPFSLVRTGEQTLEGHFIAFGHCPEDLEKFHKLAIYAITESDDHLFLEFDVTEQVKYAKNQRYIVIYENGANICDEDHNVLKVDEWNPLPPIIIPME